MKIRKGFVSNSSSSSFIVAFPKDIELSDNAIHQYLYGSVKSVVYGYGDNVSTTQASQIIRKDMEKQIPNNDESLMEALQGWFGSAPDCNDFRIPEPGKSGYELKCDWDAYQTAHDEYRAKFLEEFKQKVGDGVNLYTFTFSDNEGSVGCTMEHGDTFDRVEHVRISNH